MSKPQEKKLAWYKSRWVRRTGEIALFLALFQGILYWQTRNLLDSGQKVPEFQLSDLDGNVVSSAHLKGKRVILHFWASWCSVCKTNIPVFTSMHSLYQHDPLFISIAIDGDRTEIIRKMRREKGISYPVLVGNGEIARLFRISAYPTTYFIDAQGRIRSQDSGFLSPLGLWYKTWKLRF